MVHFWLGAAVDNTEYEGSSLEKGLVLGSSLPKNLYRQALLPLMECLVCSWVCSASSTVEIQHRMASSDSFTIVSGDELKRWWRWLGMKSESARNLS